jgi:Ca2+/Na+ antiporter
MKTLCQDRRCPVSDSRLTIVVVVVVVDAVGATAVCVIKNYRMVCVAIDTKGTYNDDKKNYDTSKAHLHFKVISLLNMLLLTMLCTRTLTTFAGAFSIHHLARGVTSLVCTLFTHYPLILWVSLCHRPKLCRRAKR